MGNSPKDNKKFILRLPHLKKVFTRSKQDKPQIKTTLAKTEKPKNSGSLQYKSPYEGWSPAVESPNTRDLTEDRSNNERLNVSPELMKEIIRIDYNDKKHSPTQPKKDKKIDLF